MKYITILFILFTYALVNAQVSEGLRSMSQGNNNALVVSLTGVSIKDAENIWKKYVDQYNGKSKYNRKTDELFTDNASIPSLSDNTIDLYGKGEKLGDDIIFAAWFDLGGAYLSSAAHPTRYQAGSDIMVGFIKEIDKYKTTESLKNEEKKLDGLNSNMKQLVRDKEGYEKDIKKAEDKIAELKIKIEENIKQQATKQAEIDTQKSSVDNVKSNLDKI